MSGVSTDLSPERNVSITAASSLQDTSCIESKQKASARQIHHTTAHEKHIRSRTT
jgi:hypothetical protein